MLTVFVEQAKLFASDAAANDGFGGNVAIDGDTAVVSASQNDDAGFNSGSAYIFQRSGTTWVEQLKLTASDAAANDYFGSVAIDGSTVVVGAPLADNDVGVDSGSVYVFQRSGTTWIQQAKLTANDAAADDQFGRTVAIDGDTVVVGSWFDDDAGGATGSAYVFQRSGTSWSQQAKLTANDAPDVFRFGSAISISGDTVAVAAPADPVNNAGSVYVFQWSGTNWMQQAKLTASDAMTHDFLGFSDIAIDGDTIGVGTYGMFSNATSNPGRVYVFQRSGTTWSEQAKLTASDAAFGDKFGASIAIDGNTMAIGAFSNDVEGNNAGSAYLFQRSGTTWSQQAQILADDAAANDQFGISIAIDGGTVVVGARGANDDAGRNIGSAYVFVPSNAAPSINSNSTVNVAENQTSVIDVQSSDPDGEAENGGGLTYSLTGGADKTAFLIDPGTGVLTFNAAPDFENPGDAGENNVYDVQVTVTDSGRLTGVQDISVSVINQASITGQIFVDVDADGLFDANEPGIDGAAVELLNASGTAVLDTVFSSDGGSFLFEDLDPATYRLHEVQPTGVDDGAEGLGSLGGSIVSNDTMQLTLNRTDASDYVFAELGQQVTSGDTATIGFWQNKHGQTLINAGGAGLANWLSTNFSNVFGNVFGSTSVADFYKEELFKQKAKMSAGPAKVDAQFMATAMATYFTSSNLSGTVAAGYGFHVSDTGIGTKVVNVASKGAAFGVVDGTDLTIMQLLLATNALTDQPDSLTGAASIYDTNGDGVIDAAEAALRVKANALYTFINEGGDI